MGYKLRRIVADTLPAWVKGGDRLVVLELADQARDETSIAYGRDLLTTVARRCGLANPKAVGKVLGRLAEKGIELRVQLVGNDGRPLTDSRGRPVFAYDGRSTTYRIPEPLTKPPKQAPSGPPPGGPLDAEAPPAGDDHSPEVPQEGDHFSTDGHANGSSGPPAGGPQTPSGPPAGGQWSPQEPPVVPQRGVSGPPAGGPLPSVSPHLPSPSPQSVVAAARETDALAYLTATYGLTDEEAATVWSGAQRMASGTITNPVPYLKAMTSTGSMAALIEAAQRPVDEGQGNEDDRPGLQLVNGPAPYDRTVREALAAAYQPPILASLDDAEPTSSAQDDQDEQDDPYRRGADRVRAAMADAREAAVRKAAQ